VLNTKVQIPCSVIFKSYLTFTQSSVEKVFACLYPRIFSIHNLDPNSDDCPGRPVPDEKWSAAILPKNCQASAKAIEETGVYLVDNGEQFLVAVNPQAEDSAIQSVDFPQQIFGVESIIDLQQTYALDAQEDNDYNSLVFSIIEELKRAANGYTKSMLVTIKG